MTFGDLWLIKPSLQLSVEASKVGSSDSGQHCTRSGSRLLPLAAHFAFAAPFSQVSRSMRGLLAPAALIGLLIMLAVMFAALKDEGREHNQEAPESTENWGESTSNFGVRGYSHTHIRESGPVVEGSGVRTQENRELGQFDGVDIATSADFKITRGEKSSIRIAGDDNIVPLVSTEVRDRTLFVFVPHSYATNNKLQMLITTPGVRRVAINGSADGFLDAVTDDAVDITISGSGDLGGIGTVDQLNVTIAGSGDVLLHRLRTKQTRITINGSGDAEVHATESLNATVNGSGDVKYSGAPEQVDPQVNGSGSIRPVK